MTRHLLDLSHPIRQGLTTYPGLPTPEIGAHLDRDAAETIYGPGVTFHIGMVTMCANTGTYIDVPFHRFADGHDLIDLPLERVSGVPGICIDGDPRRIELEALGDTDVSGFAVLFRTGHSKHFGTPQYMVDHPYLASELARTLVERGAACVGIDSLNVDATSGPEGDGRPVHTILLRNDIPIIEHLTDLGSLPRSGFTFTAVPPKIEQLGSFPVRAFAEL
jgi:kynurenine formamidase